MRKLRTVLALAAAFIVAPVSYTTLLIWYAPPALDFGWFFFETIAKAQFWALVILSPFVVATKAWEWLKRFI